MKTFLLAALLLLVALPLAAPVASADHSGWSCSYVGNAVRVCTADGLWWPEDCFLHYRILGEQSPTYCYRL